MPSDDKVADILARFPGPVTLFPSRPKWLLLLGGCALFSFGGLLMIRSGEAGGWFVLIMFALAALIPLVVLVPGSGRLLLDRDGFDYRTIFISKRIHWRDADNFAVGKVPPANIRLVAYDDAGTGRGFNADLTVKLTGRNAMLGDTYGLSAADLARLLQAWRDRVMAMRDDGC